MEYLLEAFAQIFTLKVLGFMVLGSIWGIVASAIPGFTITMAVVLTLPFTFSMEPIVGIATMISVYVGGFSGGLISAALLGIPGTPSAICTTFDARPMAEKGEPGRALSIGVLASFFGGLVSIIVCILTAGPIAKFGLRFGPWEMFSLIFFALTLIASLGGKAIVKGLLAGAFGLLISTVGIDPVGGKLRFTMGLSQLAIGFAFLPILIGLFAVPQMMKSITKIRQSSGEDSEISNSFISGSINIPWIKTLKELSKHWVGIVRSGLIGCLVGALPAAGGSIATFLSYDQAKKFSKKPDEFGKGNIEGIIASEAGNSGVAGGSLIPTIALGIPGSAVTAIMLGALMLHGITPGPLLFKSQPVLVYGIYVSLIIGNIIMLLVQALGMKAFIKVCNMPGDKIVPVVLMLCVAGSYALNNRFFDVIVFSIFGVVGYLLSSAKVPLAPMVLGVILGPLAEANLRKAIMTDPNIMLFFTRPISLVLIIISILSLLISIYQLGKDLKKEQQITSKSV